MAVNRFARPWKTAIFCSNGLSVRVPGFPFRRGFSAQSQRTTLRGHLVLLVLVTLLPALLFSALVFYLFARDERAGLQGGMMETVRALRQAVDTELKSNVNTLDALAASELLDRGDLRNFYRMTKRVLASQEGWKTVILHDPSGRELLNLAVPFGSPRGTPVERKAFNDVLQTKRPAFVGFVPSPRTGPVVALRVPVLRDDAVKYILTAAIDPKTFSDILVKQRLSRGFSATLFDQNKNIIARVPEPEKFIGQGVSSILDELEPQREGWVVGSSREGLKSYAVFSRSELSGYTIALVIPASAIEGPLRRSLSAVAAVGLIFLALGLGLAVAIGRRISEPIIALASSAEAIGKGGTGAALPASSVVEVETLRGSIEDSVRLLEERRHIEQERWESEQRFGAIFNQVQVGIAECEMNGRFLLVNDGYCAIAGLSRERLLATRMQDLIHPNDMALYREQIEQLSCDAPHSPTERRYVRPDGSEVWVSSDMSLVCDAEGRPHFFVAVAQDITDRKHAEEELYRLKDELEKRVAARTEELTRTNTELFRTLDQREKLEAQLRQAQKMEAIGALAGGIAHDFNNILGIIAVHASSLRNANTYGDEAAEKGAAILDMSQRGAALVQQLLTFAQERAAEHKPIDLNTLVSDLMKMMVNTFPRTIAFALDLDPDLPAIYGDQTQVEQALLNLALNARDAMSDGGRLTIRTARISGEDLHKSHPEATARTYVKIEVDDTGAGMDDQVKERLFEPFFTTKKDLGGSGLGLPVVYGIVSSHRGLIDVESVKGRGTAFRLYLPIRSTAEAAGRPPERAVLAGRGEGVLIVEDEKNLLALVETVLKRNGYETFTAVHGEQAVDVYRRNKQEIDLVLLDLGLPVMDGHQVYEELKREDPHVTVVISTGYVDPEVRIDLVKHGVNGFIQKPLTPQAVLQKIRSVLDRRKIIRGRKTNVLAS
jgi:PAS domain S-box-containing protein